MEKQLNEKSNQLKLFYFACLYMIHMSDVDDSLSFSHELKSFLL